MKKLIILLTTLGTICGVEVSANQMFRAGGSSGTQCPSGSIYKGSGFCQARSDKQFFRAGGSSGTQCPSGSIYKGSGFCQTR